MSAVAFTSEGDFKSDVEINVVGQANGEVRVIFTTCDSDGIIDQGDVTLQGEREGESVPDNRIEFVYHGTRRVILNPSFSQGRDGLLLSGEEESTGMFKHFSVSKIGLVA